MAKTNASEGITGRATLRHVRISPQKARLMIDLVRGKQVEPALQVLRFTPKKSARLLEKVVQSALMNAKEAGANVDRLWVSAGWVDSGRTMKRVTPRARGAANVLCKRSSHITVFVSERN